MESEFANWDMVDLKHLFLIGNGSSIWFWLDKECGLSLEWRGGGRSLKFLTKNSRIQHAGKKGAYEGVEASKNGSLILRLSTMKFNIKTFYNFQKVQQHIVETQQRFRTHCCLQEWDSLSGKQLGLAPKHIRYSYHESWGLIYTQHLILMPFVTYCEKGAFLGFHMPYIHRPTAYARLHSRIQ